MAKLTLEANTSSSTGEYPVLPPDSIITVSVQEIEERTATNRSTGESWQKLEFAFRIEAVPSQLGADAQSLVGSRIWGSTPLRFTMHPDNKLRQWVEALLGGLQLDEGFELETDNLIGRNARAVISNYNKKDGRAAHQVAGLLPPADAAPVAIFEDNSTPAFPDNASDDPPF